MTQKRRHFTLIELLVVMGLIGLLVTLAVPSFTRLAKGKAVPAAAEQIKRQLEQAQALAIANRAYVGLIIVNGTASSYNFSDDSDDLTNSPNQYLLASTRPAILFKSGTKYYFDKWAPDSSWSKPIENARIVKVSDSYSDVPEDGNAITWNLPEKTTDKLTSPLEEIDKISNKCAIIFAPDGGLDSTSDIFLFISGCTQNGTTLTFADSKTDYLILYINRLSGKTVYFTRPNPNSNDNE